MTHPRRAPFVVVGLWVAFVLATGPVLAGSGWLDPSFGHGGLARVGSPWSGFTAADYLKVRVGPTGRIFVFEDLFSGDSDSGFIRARTSKGFKLTSFAGGKPLLVGGSGDGVFNRGIFPLAKGGVVYVTMIGNPAGPATIKVVQRAADGHVVRSRTWFSSAGGGSPLHIVDVTRLPGGSLRTCGPVESPDERRLLGLTSTLEPDLRLGPSGYRTLPIASCRGVTSDPSGHVYVAGGIWLGDHWGFEVLALTSAGEPITTWGASGHVVVDLAGLNVTTIKGQFVALADGSLLLATEAYPDSSYTQTTVVVARITPNGALDPAFSGDGIATFAPVGGRSKVFAMDADSSGRPVLSLAYYPAGGGVKAFIARVTVAGVIDASFGQAGFVPVSRAPRDLDVDSEDRIVTVVPDGADILLARRT